MDNQYLIPANSKKSMLIFGFFTPFDLGVFAIGITVTMVLFLMIKSNQLSVVLAILAPALISGFLVMPIPNYHNVMTLLGNILKFFTGRKKYYWRGWCINSESEK